METGVKSRGARALFSFLSYWLKRGLSSWLSRIYLLNVCKPSIPLPYRGGVKSSIPRERWAAPLPSFPRPPFATFILSQSIFLERIDGGREVMESTRTSLCLRSRTCFLSCPIYSGRVLSVSPKIAPIRISAASLTRRQPQRSARSARAAAYVQ